MSEQLSPVSHEPTAPFSCKEIIKLLLAFGMHLAEEHNKEIKEMKYKHEEEIIEMKYKHEEEQDKLKDEIMHLEKVNKLNDKLIDQKEEIIGILKEKIPFDPYKEEQVRCFCPDCYAEGWTIVSKARAKELNYKEELEEACPFGDNCRGVRGASSESENEEEEEEEYDEREFDFEPEIEREESDILEGIKCVDCGRILPPHTKMEHLDFSHPIHECPHRVF